MTATTTYVAKEPDSHGRIHYTADENSVWSDLITAQLPRVKTRCAGEYLHGLRMLKLSKSTIPDCALLSQQLQEISGWQVEPVPAIIGFERFFGMLASRTFPVASFIRRREHFDYVEEPDIFHEVFGHTPLLCNQHIADFSQTIGEAGLQADSKDHAWLIRLYWFTVEFGLIRKNDRLKALGAGLASSTAELSNALDNPAVVHKPFDVLDILRTPYRIDIPQPVYFVLNSVDDLSGIDSAQLMQSVSEAKRLGMHAPMFKPKLREVSKHVH